MNAKENFELIYKETDPKEVGQARQLVAEANWLEAIRQQWERDDVVILSFWYEDGSASHELMPRGLAEQILYLLPRDPEFANVRRAKIKQATDMWRMIREKSKGG